MPTIVFWSGKLVSNEWLVNAIDPFSFQRLFQELNSRQVVSIRLSNLGDSLLNTVRGQGN